MGAAPGKAGGPESQSIGDAANRVIDALREHGWKVKGAGRDRWRAQCPAHGDRSTSDLNLAVARGDQGVLLACHSGGCVVVDIASALGLQLPDLFDRDGRAVYDYGAGHRVFRTRTSAGKSIRQEGAPARTSLWTPPGSRPIKDASMVVLAEGEKTADALVRMGAPCAATWPGGTGGIRKADFTPLAGKIVIICPDTDAAGQKALRQLQSELAEVAADVRVWRVPEPHNDAADLWVAGGNLDDLTPDDVEHVENAAAPPRMPRIVNLTAFLDEPDIDPDYRLDEVMPTGGNVMLAAQFKAGKSTLVANLMRSLVDGEDFLGRFRCTRLAVRVVLIDDELDPRTLRRWLREQSIENTDRVDVVSLRGMLGSFNILDENVRAEWARMIGPADVLIFDCLRPALDALGLDENHDGGRFLVAFDALRHEAGIPESVTVHHMGHGAERSRGDSRLRDWPDVEWRIVRESDDPASPRYFSAFGRDVDVPEGRVTFADRRLTYQDGSRREAKATAAADDLTGPVLAFITEHPGCSGREIERGVDGRAQHVRAAKDRLVSAGLVDTTKGARGAILHSARPSASQRVPDALVSASSASIGTHCTDSALTDPVRPADADDPGYCEHGTTIGARCRHCTGEEGAA